jgi:hypothetical protein
MVRLNFCRYTLVADGLPGDAVLLDAYRCFSLNAPCRAANLVVVVRGGGDPPRRGQGER